MANRMVGLWLSDGDVAHADELAKFYNINSRSGVVRFLVNQAWLTHKLWIMDGETAE